MPRPLETLLIQVVVYLFLWLSSEYVAMLMSIIIGAICAAVFAVSLLVEAVERSKVPRSYYVFMGVSTLAPVLAAGLYHLAIWLW